MKSLYLSRSYPLDGTLPRVKRALTVDSTAAMVGAGLGTSTTTSYIESAAGVNAGGRTGLVTVTVGEVSSVVVRLVEPPVPPGRNSETVPVTVTASPTCTVGAEEVKTNRPSLVRGSASGGGSWYQKPLVVFAVTTPGAVTLVPTKGEMWPVP